MARNKYPEETIRRIVDVSKKLFLEKGYENTSIQDIINELGNLSKGAIYHHFKSKEEILIAVMEDIYGGAKHPSERVFDREMPAIDKLHEMLRVSIMDSRQNYIFTSAPDLTKNSKMLTLQMKSTMEEIAPMYVQPILEQGIREGTIKTKYPKELAQMVMLLFNIWLNPLFCLDSVEEMKNRYALLQQILQLFGLDIMDEEIVKRLYEYAELAKRSDK